MKQATLLCMLFWLHSHAHKGDTVLKYFDANLNVTSKKTAVYFGAAIRQQNGWYVFALYPDTSVLLKAFYKDKALTIKEGPYEVYYPKNKPAVSGFFHNNSRVGVWRSWYQNTQPKDSGFFYYNIQVGLWRSWYANGRLQEESVFKTDTTLRVLRASEVKAFLFQFKNAGTRDGMYKSWYETGVPEAAGAFTNDTMTGTWRWYHQNGKQSTTEVYKNGLVTWLECFDTSGANTGMTCSIARPALLRQYGDYRMYVRQNLMWPEEAFKQGLEDNVQVSFRVTKEGKLDSLVVLTAEPLFEKAVKELFATMTDWLPAISHNRVIDSEEQLTIPFFKNKGSRTPDLYESPFDD